MNGAHDMGGAHGFGPIEATTEEPYFHSEWERRVFAMTLASGGGRWNLDTSRFARENAPPADYLGRSYYETWLYGLEKLLVQTGAVAADEIAQARAGQSFEPDGVPGFTADKVEAAMRAGGKARSDEQRAPLFVIGDRVRASIDAPPTHTRCPRYVRGRAGVIERDHGVFVFPDTNAHGQGPKPQHVYAVRFEADELWGSASQGGAVYVDLWDDYLERA